MKMILRKITLRNFKGAKDRTIEFDGNAKIKGANATGKSTLSDAYYWLFTNYNTAMINNPPITPKAETECESKVEAELEIDGKKLTVVKTQIYKQKQDGDKVVSAVTNHYYINSVEKSYRDFVADLTERGIDMDNFLIFSHPSAFTADNSKQGREKQRAMLFKMCEGITDEDVASGMEGIDELKELMSDYKLNEIEQMQKSTIRNIKDTVGDDNIIINARIDELISQKSTLDIKVLQQQKKEYEAEIKRCEKELESLAESKADIHEKISELRIKRDEITSKANQSLNEQKTELDKSIREYQSIIDEKNFKLSQNKAEIERQEGLLSKAKEDTEKQRVLYKMEQDSVLDEGDLSCPVCHRTYSEEKLSEIKAEFEKHKAERLKVIKSSGENLKKNIKSIEKELKSLKDQQQALDRVISETIKMRDEKQAEIDKLPVSADMFKDDNFVLINNEIADLEKDLSADDDTRKQELESARNVAKTMLHQIMADIGVVEKNKEIDERIADLRKQRTEAETNKAKAEKILYQIEQFKKFKNDKLSDEINKHFKVAQFRLFRQLKNGSTEDACDVLVNGKEINTQVNQATQVIAKLDIIRGLSDYFNSWLPVFVDDFALFTSDSDKQIVMDNQLIKLIATDGVNDLKVEKEK